MFKTSFFPEIFRCGSTITHINIKYPSTLSLFQNHTNIKEQIPNHTIIHRIVKVHGPVTYFLLSSSVAICN